MSKLDCTSIRITGNTNFKKKLTSFVSKSVWGNPAMKVNWNSPTHSRRWSCCFSTVPWTNVMNEHWGTKYYTQKLFFEKFIWKPKCFCTQMKFTYFSFMCPFAFIKTQLKFLIDAMKTSQQSCIEFERVS